MVRRGESEKLEFREGQIHQMGTEKVGCLKQPVKVDAQEIMNRVMQMRITIHEKAEPTMFAELFADQFPREYADR
eukprot:14250459-Alexandrium_andersonii.AAC.1